MYKEDLAKYMEDSVKYKENLAKYKEESVKYKEHLMKHNQLVQISWKYH